MLLVVQYTMLLADFIVEARNYVNDHLDDFTWEGFDVYAYDEKGEQLNWGYTCSDMEDAVDRKDMLLKNYSKVVIRDNATRSVFEYIRAAPGA